MLKFGLPALLAAIVGAWFMTKLTVLGNITSYTIGDSAFAITPIKVLIGFLIFSLIEFLPARFQFNSSEKILALGGILSGFFGGLSGHQGALRSAFLIKSSRSPSEFVATNAVIALMIDIIRLASYFLLAMYSTSPAFFEIADWRLISAGVLSALLGVIIGKKVLDKVSMKCLRTATLGKLVILSLTIMEGLI